MVKNGFELVETLERTDTYSGTGGTSGIVFIMKKKMINDNGGEISHNGNKQ
ncbi:hypothetical protein G5B00_15035 [Parapedobacter sp. SGR-10]|uniref:hypothetical protein n=1 Tax=Parapedobacter sp. SGR-10 TaxID=2710879 RepID=UPI0013D87F91|nr:hypothetical protein [Parapedobacter sp. SGR-10]NGF57832.1 hypothetical protein [Parapedobacter sp. SGR-10]